MIKDWEKEFDEKFPPPKLDGYTTAVEAMILERTKANHDKIKQFIQEEIEKAYLAGRTCKQNEIDYHVEEKLKELGLDFKREFKKLI